MKTWKEVFNHFFESDIVLDDSNKIMSQVFNVPIVGQMMIGDKVFRPEDNQEIEAGNNTIYVKDINGETYCYTTWNANYFKGGKK